MCITHDTVTLLLVLNALLLTCEGLPRISAALTAPMAPVLLPVNIEISANCTLM